MATFKICCTEWSGTLYSVYNDIRKQRSERLAIDTSETFLPSFTEITLSIVMVFFFRFVVGCFVLFLKDHEIKAEKESQKIKERYLNNRGEILGLSHSSCLY